MQNNDSVAFANKSATMGPFVLKGGYYSFISVSGTQSGSNHIDVTRLAGDGSTVIVMIAGAQTGATTNAYGYLPPGTYSITLTGTLTGIYAELVRIPIN